MANPISGAAGGAAAGSSFGPYGAAIGGLIGGVSSLLGGNAAAKAKNEAYNNYINQLKAEGVANPEDYVSQYQDIDPSALQQVQAQQVQAQQQGDTGLADIQSDPALRNAQVQALLNLQQRGQGNLTIQDQAAEDSMLGKVQQSQQGAQGAIEQQMARRGMLGSGGELAARLASAGSDYAAAGANAEQLAAAHQQNAMQAALDASTAASNLDSADYKKAAAAASAQDAINAFNTTNKTNAGVYNANSNQAAGNANVGQNNSALYYNTGLTNKNADQKVAGKLQNIQDTNAKNDAISKAGIAKAGVKADQYNNLGTGVGKIATTIGNGINGISQNNATNDTSKAISDFYKNYSGM